jgi:hypothetical protein
VVTDIDVAAAEVLMALDEEHNAVEDSPMPPDEGMPPP